MYSIFPSEEPEGRVLDLSRRSQNWARHPISTADIYNGLANGETPLPYLTQGIAALMTASYWRSPEECILDLSHSQRSRAERILAHSTQVIEHDQSSSNTSGTNCSAGSSNNNGQNWPIFGQNTSPIYGQNSSPILGQNSSPILGQNSSPILGQTSPPVLASSPSPNFPRSTHSHTGVRDPEYYEKRRKNNAAAKKSRDAKRRRELAMKQRLEFLEKENKSLRTLLQFCHCRNGRMLENNVYA